ncbi:hypothetical protein BDV3_005850 [Batrachochytrium dendrobatidis]
MIIEHVDTSGTSSAKCRFLLFMQLQPLPAKLQDILDLENVQNEGARTKISPMTMGMMIILDAYMCIVLISIALMFPELFSPFKDHFCFECTYIHSLGDFLYTILRYGRHLSQ